MEEMEQQSGNATIWPSVFVGAVVFGLIVFALSIITGYIQINSEPSGSLFQPSMLGYLVVCLVGAFGGMVSVWHYTREYQAEITLGRGALIGFMAGIVIILVSTLLSQGWKLIDPNFTDRMMQATIRNFEASNMPDAQKQQQIDMIAQNFKDSETLVGVLKTMGWGLPVYGLLNLVTGMIGVKLFGRKQEV